MNVWFRGAALAGSALLLMGMHVGAQIREGGSSVTHAPPGGGPAERSNHPVVLWNNRDNLFAGGERIVTQFVVKADTERIAKVHRPAGIDGVIAYPGSGMLMVRGTKEAVASYRASLAKLDQEEAPGDAQEQPKRKESGKADRAAETMSRPMITLGANTKYGLNAERIDRKGAVVQATGNVVIRLADGIRIHAHQVRVTTKGGEKQIVIEK